MPCCLPQGMQTACGVNFDFKIQCFGSNDRTDDDKREGQATPPDGKFKQVSVGGMHACALCNDPVTCKDLGSSMNCWGNNRMKQVCACAL